MPDSALARILADFRGERAELLPILHRVQEAFGCISEAHQQEVARALRLPLYEVNGVVSFYTHFSKTRHGLPLRICQDLACHLRGASALIRDLGAWVRQAQGRGAELTAEPVSCLGQCDRAPAMMVGGEIITELTPQTLQAVVERLASGRPASTNGATEVGGR
ncbi:MAG: NAD(P)H-dependent oxidoreductase subunit E [Deltaproteobacteria bacterium]|nr:NAD(P)H-dependent oxidoreductase subunit E [Deltaproteobacteria bacterium]MBI3078465.1 NAD(P)H-dependent oxidoreductase subunit E [Deltaproteobacteria bacterium]